MKRTIATILTALAAGMIMPATAAHASSCTQVLSQRFFQYSCTLPANSANHFVHVSTSSFVTVEAYDVDSLVTIYSSQSGWTGVEKTITGLYGNYRLRGFPQLAGSQVGYGWMTLSNT